MNDDIRFLKVNLIGVRALYDSAVLGAVLDEFERESLTMPSQWSKAERGGPPYTRSEVIDWAAPGKVKMGGQLFLKRKKALKFVATLRLGHEPGIAVEFSGSTAERNYPMLFDFADRLAAAFEPDVGWVQVVPQPKRWSTNEDTEYELMWRAAQIAPLNYRKEGPRALAMRTYLGPHFITQFGEEHLRQLPIEAAALDWQGVVIDLVERPWEASVSTLATAWRAGMDALADARVFAETTCKQTEQADYVKYAKGTEARIEWNHKRGN